MQWVVLAGVIITFATAVLGFLQSRQNKGKIHQIHVMVNHQRTMIIRRNKVLAATLRDNGIRVPAIVDSEDID